jgi:hypothetical protein
VSTQIMMTDEDQPLPNAVAAKEEQVENEMWPRSSSSSHRGVGDVKYRIAQQFRSFTMHCILALYPR